RHYVKRIGDAKGSLASLKAQRPDRIDGPVEVSIVAGHPDQRRRDADNLLKAVLDFLVAHQVISDDSQMIRIAAGWEQRRRTRPHFHHDQKTEPYYATSARYARSLARRLRPTYDCVYSGCLVTTVKLNSDDLREAQSCLLLRVASALSLASSAWPVRRSLAI